MKNGSRAAIRRALAVVALAGALVIALAGTAWAHFPVVSGSVVCTNGQHVITWSVGNDPRPTADLMDITGWSVTINGVVVGDVTWNDPITGIPPIPARITGTTVLDGSLSGVVVLSVTGFYPTRTFPPATRTGSVTLPTNCVPVTTTTTTATTTTTTTAPTTTTTTAPTTTTTGATTSTTGATTTTVPETSTSTAPQVVSTTTTTAPTTTTTGATTTTTAPATTTTRSGGTSGGGSGGSGGSGGGLSVTGGSTDAMVIGALAAISIGAFALGWARKTDAEQR